MSSVEFQGECGASCAQGERSFTVVPLEKNYDHQGAEKSICFFFFLNKNSMGPVPKDISKLCL